MGWVTRIENNRFFNGISKLSNFNNLCSDFSWPIYDLCYALSLLTKTQPNSWPTQSRTLSQPWHLSPPDLWWVEAFWTKGLRLTVSIDSSVVHCGASELRLKLCRSRFKYQLCHVLGLIVSLNLSFLVCKRKVTVVGILEDCGEDSMRGTSEVLTDCLPHGKWMPVLSLCWAELSC